MLILHIATRAEWEAAQASGSYTGNTLASEGFIHCAKPAQLMHVLTRYFPSLINHVILEIDPARVTSEIRYEGKPGASEEHLFPHIHGPLNVNAVTRHKNIW
jgi:uncharacterized protein (DUF952 family)